MLFGLFKKKKDKKEEDNKKGKISEWSFQRFCGFYGDRILPDPNFNSKIEGIKNCILNKHYESIDEIARESGCTFDECVMKIKYLKNKRVLENYYIDHFNRALKPCTPSDQKLLEKYYTMLYHDHYSIDEMSRLVPNFHNKPMSIVREDVYKDIKYLYDRCVINGIKIDEESQNIIYYTVEKHAKAKGYITLNCSKCGALVDISRGGNGRCEYCGSVETDTTTK
jgi:hypothetical protein